jgi:hypothetical protein
LAWCSCLRPRRAARTSPGCSPAARSRGMCSRRAIGCPSESRRSRKGAERCRGETACSVVETDARLALTTRIFLEATTKPQRGPKRGPGRRFQADFMPSPDRPRRLLRLHERPEVMAALPVAAEDLPSDATTDHASPSVYVRPQPRRVEFNRRRHESFVAADHLVAQQQVLARTPRALGGCAKGGGAAVSRCRSSRPSARGWRSRPRGALRRQVRGWRS